MNLQITIVFTGLGPRPQDATTPIANDLVTRARSRRIFCVRPNHVVGGPRLVCGGSSTDASRCNAAALRQNDASLPFIRKNIGL